jgi:hypothetical protein
VDDVKREVPPIVEGEDASAFKTKRGPLLVDNRQIHNNKHRFDILRGILVNTDDKQIAASDEITSVLRSPLQTFSVPNRLGIATKE